MKALVTGGTGFVGRPVVERLLAEGHSVRLFARNPEAAVSFRSPHIETVQGTLEDTPSLIRALEGVDLFYHIGEIKNVTRIAARRNVDLVSTLADEFARIGPRRFVFVSSITVAGIPETLPATEETPAATVLQDHYTDCKRRCEEVLKEKAAGWEFAIVRPAPVYGPGSRHLGKLVSMIDAIGPLGLPFIGDAKNVAPLIHVKDLAEAIVLAGTRTEAAGQTFNITDGQAHTWFDFFKAIADALNRHLRIVPIPASLIKFAALPVNPLASFVGFDLDPIHYVDYFSKDLRFSPEKAERLLGWRPTRTLADGAREMVAQARKG